MILSQELTKKLADHLSHFQGNADQSFTSICPVEDITSESLVFCSKPQALTQALQSPAKGVVAHKEALEAAELPNDKTYFASNNPYLAMALALQNFAPVEWLAGKAPSIHPSASISENAQIGKNVHIGAFVSVNDGAVIEDNCIIRENTLVDHGAKVGEGSHLHPFVMVGHDCIVGKNCVVQSFTTIGSEGFGYVTDEKRTHHAIPHKGNVILEDSVEIGANSTVDRGTFGSTVIGQGTVIDNKAHIAHNCEIGANSLMTGGFMVAGSTKIGKNIIAGACTRIAGHLNIPDNTVFGAMTVVLSKITKPGVYGGHPCEPIDSHKKNYVSLKKIAEMRSQISAIMKKISN